MLLSFWPGVLEHLNGIPASDRLPLVAKIVELTAIDISLLAENNSIDETPNGHTLQLTLKETGRCYIIGYGLSRNPDAITIWFFRSPFELSQNELRLAQRIQRFLRRRRGPLT